ncbi:sulfotransferase family protein [Thalassospira xianhensis]|uniref:Sulfotransferase domain-containing protein n=1 Tax=Thalassospira xianhensis MCCC 1A02616 TaxID=1177929 RepID=A0A367U9H9_9PROT|nr:sulfotransferase [Thalassospira xianhensis]RCK03944.1 hypothetical protein TH5_22705 [Thalassospira xianhensis MCCC 1A02616]
MKKPNFFIIGAPKCGTTSMAKWLSEHPEIFIPPEKELHFFCFDFPHHDKYWKKNFDEYEKFFSKADQQHIAVGEASTHYWGSSVAIGEILSYAPNAKFIAMLRAPHEMAVSLHEQAIWGLQEDQEDFATAWRLQIDITQGIKPPKSYKNPYLVQYAEWCNLGTKVENLLKLVPKEKCHFIFIDDMKKNPRSVYLSLLDFLNVPDDGRTKFPIYNSAKKHKSLKLARTVRALQQLRNNIGFNPLRGMGILTSIREFNKVEKPRTPISAEMQEELISFFRPEVRKLEQLLDRDLSHWLQSNERKLSQQ